jgi:hypothetical protein
MVTPFRDTGFLDAHQRNFNYILSSSRIIIDRSFGKLKARWSILTYLYIDVVDIPATALACSILQNYCEAQNEACLPHEHLQASPVKMNSEVKENEEARGPLFLYLKRASWK